MASQRVLLLTIGGLLAECVWEDIRRWSDARAVTSNDEWSSDDWPVGTRNEVNAFIAKLTLSGFAAPILYRSEHIDCWSMGDVYETAFVKMHPECCRRLHTTHHEVIATWVRFTERIVPDTDSADETVWLYNRVNEAISAWGKFAEHRLIVLIRSVLGELWTDEEVADSLRMVPEWWSETEPSGDSGVNS